MLDVQIGIGLKAQAAAPAPAAAAEGAQAHALRAVARLRALRATFKRGLGPDFAALILRRLLAPLVLARFVRLTPDRRLQAVVAQAPLNRAARLSRCGTNHQRIAQALPSHRHR